MRKVLDAAALVSLVLSGTLAGVGFYTYLYVTNAENQQKILDNVIGKVSSQLPIPKIPGSTGPVKTRGGKTAPATGFGVPF